MNWQTANIPPGLKASIRHYRTPTHALALWDHRQCRGWQLYWVRSASRVRWIAGAGVDSVGWDDDRAIRWAEKLIPIQSADASKPQIDASAIGGQQPNNETETVQKPTGGSLDDDGAGESNPKEKQP